MEIQRISAHTVCSRHGKPGRQEGDTVDQSTQSSRACGESFDP
eukprot:CAMPEP_0198558722 /NCGR_PEP_ID=MMETSP1462-20131121/91017_1 /TAXON_ID=1333877 /ORGANISM="Brandtodinium nutriculum, Strain RCC3387" /LENGTH=42 /DNA_ID= /DNA_START= /DNA_END= /DNA_ORIENTATION=